MFQRLSAFAAQEDLPFIVTCFYRTASEQAQMLAAGRSKVKRSQHQDWLAIDIVLVDSKWQAIWEHHRGDGYEKLGLYWESLSPHLRWGGNFGRTENQVGWDPYHFELAREALK
jgi:uncharacterized protein YcbK (DUF882 family)